MLNQEKIYQLLQNEDWDSLINVFYERKDIIKKDPLLSQSLDITLSIITKKANELEKNSNFLVNLEKILVLDYGNFIKLKEEQKEAISIAIVNGNKENYSYCYQYAKLYPENEICKEVILEYENRLPNEVNHSQVEQLYVTENKEIQLNNDFRKSLFNSIQEVEFYLALKRVFDSYQVYPNVGLSSVIDFDSLKDSLTTKERNFFFQSSIDFVVLEPFRNYFPVYFFEIDSVWHDSIEQKEKDKMKDKIFSISGLKLIRIRKVDNSIDEQEFEKLLYEIRQGISYI